MGMSYFLQNLVVLWDSNAIMMRFIDVLMVTIDIDPFERVIERGWPWDIPVNELENFPASHVWLPEGISNQDSWDIYYIYVYIYTHIHI